jgi:hypothetical protein
MDHDNVVRFPGTGAAADDALTALTAFADAILDRLVHNAYRIALDGPSLRKTGTENSRDIRTGAAT